MTEHVQRFIEFLRFNRNVSPHTARAYRSDITQFLVHVGSRSGSQVADLQPAQFDRAAVRGFVALDRKSTRLNSSHT